MEWSWMMLERGLRGEEKAGQEDQRDEQRWEERDKSRTDWLKLAHMYYSWSLVSFDFSC